MAKKRDVAVWLDDGYARLVVGAEPPQGQTSRWVAQGVIVDEISAGLWLKTDAVQEFRPLNNGVKHVNWMFKSDQLLVRWDGIITIQAFEGGNIEIGIKPTPVE